MKIWITLASAERVTSSGAPTAEARKRKRLATRRREPRCFNLISLSSWGGGFFFSTKETLKNYLCIFLMSCFCVDLIPFNDSSHQSQINEQSSQRFGAIVVHCKIEQIAIESLIDAIEAILEKRIGQDSPSFAWHSNKHCWRIEANDRSKRLNQRKSIETERSSDSESRQFERRMSGSIAYSIKIKQVEKSRQLSDLKMKDDRIQRKNK